ncbi:MAG: hypothetical protein WCA78_00040 [Rhizomicrobium sp.]
MTNGNGSLCRDIGAVNRRQNIASEVAQRPPCGGDRVDLGQDCLAVTVDDHRKFAVLLAAQGDIDFISDAQNITVLHGASLGNRHAGARVNLIIAELLQLVPRAARHDLFEPRCRQRRISVLRRRRQDHRLALEYLAVRRLTIRRLVIRQLAIQQHLCLLLLRWRQILHYLLDLTGRYVLRIRRILEKWRSQEKGRSQRRQSSHRRRYRALQLPKFDFPHDPLTANFPTGEVVFSMIRRSEKSKKN